MTDVPIPARPLRIALDVRLNAYRVGGIPQYTAQLVEALVAIAPDDHLILLEHRTANRSIITAPNVVRRRLWTPPHNRWEQWTLPVELSRIKADVLHCPDFIPPFRRRQPAVITVHDLAFLHFPEILDDDAKRYYGQIQKAVRNADKIIAVSEATRRDLETMLDVQAERVAVVPEAAASMFQPLDLREHAQRDMNGVPLEAGTFMLFVGTIEPRKNLPMLLQALAHAATDHAPPDLVVAGPRGWLDGPVFEQIRDLKLGDRVKMLGGVGQDELLWLYNACCFYVQPELYSGFGLPVLEAMQCGAPVVVADTSALSELVQDAGMLVPANNADAWVEALRIMSSDADVRARLRERGLARDAEYSWERAARETRAVYAEVASFS
jgi:glycosyltransferase involved in cell wall biosynthesis